MSRETIPSFDAADRTALITGASSGLGAHFSRVLARSGFRVIMAARRRVELDAIAAEIVAKGGACSVLVMDVADAGSVKAAFADINNLDVLVNNAGLVRDGPALDQSEDDWDAVVDVNLKGVFLVAQAACRLMRAQNRGGSIINIASILGMRQAGSVLPYAASKAGVIQTTKSLALEWARFGVRVNALAPGYIETDINTGFWDTEAGKAMLKRIPQRRLGKLHDLEGPLLLLASDASAYMTGSVIAIDGGHLVSSL